MQLSQFLLCILNFKVGINQEHLAFETKLQETIKSMCLTWNLNVASSKQWWFQHEWCHWQAHFLSTNTVGQINIQFLKNSLLYQCCWVIDEQSKGKLSTEKRAGLLCRCSIEPAHGVIDNSLSSWILFVATF